MTRKLTGPAGETSLWRPRDGCGTRTTRVGAEVADDRADAIAIALSRAAVERIAHVERLLDLGVGPTGDLLLTTEAAPRSLGELLGMPGQPSQGEAVTILGPLIDALRRLHSIGVAHCGIDGAAVRFDEWGAPTLCEFGSALIAERVDATGFAVACGADRQALARLGEALLQRAGAGSERAANATAGWADPAGFAAADDAVFDLGEPEAVRFDRRAQDDFVPTRLIVPADSGAGLEPAGDDRERPGVGLVDRVRAVLRPVRTRVWVAAGSGLAALVAALTLLPPGGR